MTNLYVPHLTPHFWESTGLDPDVYRIFVETGSYRGDTLDFMKDKFRSLHSIELAPKWYQYCCLRFQEHPNIHLHQGDSSKLLPEIMEQVYEPAIVFLDAHYSGGSTARASDSCDSCLLAELRYLQTRIGDDIIIVDDISFFEGAGTGGAMAFTFVLTKHPPSLSSAEQVD